MTEPTDRAIDIAPIQRLGTAVRENVGRVIVGQERTVELLLVALLVEGHVLLEDVPGTGKTTLARLRPTASPAPGPRFLPLDGEPERRAIRELYQALLGEASDAGYGRPQGQTPAEYLATLRGWAPEADGPLQELTQAYVAARYSTTPIDAAQVERACQAWRAIQAAVASTGQANSSVST